MNRFSLKKTFAYTGICAIVLSLAGHTVRREYNVEIMWQTQDGVAQDIEYLFVPYDDRLVVAEDKATGELTVFENVPSHLEGKLNVDAAEIFAVFSVAASQGESCRISTSGVGLIPGSYPNIIRVYCKPPHETEGNLYYK